MSYQSPPLLDSNRLIILLFLTTSVTAPGTISEATAHCDDKEHEGEAGHSDVQPRATFSKAKIPTAPAAPTPAATSPAPSPAASSLPLGCGGQTEKKH